MVLFSAIVTGLYRRERTGQGAYVSTSLLASGVWAAGVTVQAALAGGTFYPPHDRQNPASATFDLTQTQVIEGNFCRVLAWYDNEWGFSNRMSDTAIAFANAK